MTLKSTDPEKSGCSWMGASCFLGHTSLLSCLSLNDRAQAPAPVRGAGRATCAFLPMGSRRQQAPLDRPSLGRGQVKWLLEGDEDAGKHIRKC